MAPIHLGHPVVPIALYYYSSSAGSFRLLSGEQEGLQGPDHVLKSELHQQLCPTYKLFSVKNNTSTTYLQCRLDYFLPNSDTSRQVNTNPFQYF